MLEALTGVQLGYVVGHMTMGTYTEFASTKFIVAKVCVPSALSTFPPVVACDPMSVWGLQTVGLLLGDELPSHLEMIFGGVFFVFRNASRQIGLLGR